MLKLASNPMIDGAILATTLHAAFPAISCSTLQPHAPIITELLSRVEALMFEVVQPTGLKPFATAPAAISAADVGRYHLESGGQRMRARLALHAGMQLGLSRSDAVAIAAAVELLHNASLIHDDLQDRDTTRRSRETAWFQFGDNAAICSGDLLLSAAYAALAGFSQSGYLAALIGAVHSSSATAVEGQLADLNMAAMFDLGANVARRNNALQHQKDWLEYYEKVAQAKSGALLGLPIALALIGAGMPEFVGVCKIAANAFAVGYQITDDINDMEQDRANALTQPTAGCNIVLLLERQARDAHEPLSAARAKADATAIAQKHLQIAVTQSKLLPRSVGAMLQALAEKLSQNLSFGLRST